MSLSGLNEWNAQAGGPARGVRPCGAATARRGPAPRAARWPGSPGQPPHVARGGPAPPGARPGPALPPRWSGSPGIVGIRCTRGTRGPRGSGCR
ncbi:MAG: hypothetical protein DMF45_12855 [Verrucomicrobia bacterium]|nr:MAG: hypothetical protein DMF45_12855 [Verrucomicrobiota bacterium]